MDDLLQMVAAGETTNILAVHGLRDVAAKQHRGEQADLIDVVALLPAPHPAPRDLVRHVEEIERVGGDAALVALMRGDAEVAELELLALTHEDVEGGEVAMHRAASVQRIQRA